MNAPTEPLLLTDAVKETPLRLRKLDTEAAQLQNALARVFEPLRISAEGAQILVGLDAPRRPTPDNPWLCLTINGASAAIQVSWGSVRQITGAAVEGATGDDIALLMEDGLEKILDEVEGMTSLAFRFARVQSDAPDLPVPTTLNIQGKAGGGRLVQMRVPALLSFPAAQALAAAIDPRCAKRDDLPGLVVGLRYELGQCVLPIQTYQTLEPGDAFELPETPETGRLFVEDSLSAPAQRQGDTVVLRGPFALAKTEKETQPMSDTPDVTEERAALPEATMDEVDVRLSFRAGEKMMSIRDLRGLTAGAVIEMPDPATLEVDIMAGGRLVGVGEMIDVGGRRAVQIRRIFTGH